MSNLLFRLESSIVAADLQPAADSLKGFFDAVPSGIWTLLAYLGGALIIIALVMTSIGYIQQAAKGGQGGMAGGGQQNKTFMKMLLFGVLMAGPQTWMPVAIDLIVAILEIVLDLITSVIGEL